MLAHAHRAGGAQYAPYRKPISPQVIDRSNKWGASCGSAFGFFSLGDCGFDTAGQIVGGQLHQNYVNEITVEGDNLVNSDNNARTSAGRIELGTITSDQIMSFSERSTMFVRAYLSNPSIVGSGSQVIISKTDTQSFTYGWGLYRHFDEYFTVRVDGVPDIYLTSANTYSTAGWYDIAIWFDGADQFGMLINDEAAQTATISGRRQADNAGLITAVTDAAGKGWPGKISYIHFHYGNYSEAEIREYWSNPYQIYKPRMSLVRGGFGGAAAGVPPSVFANSNRVIQSC